MKRRIIQLTRPLLKRLGLYLLRDKDYKRVQESNALFSELIHQSIQVTESARKSGMTFVIFSKDRALQLDGLLQSMFFHIKGVFLIRIIYQASNEAHNYAYKELAEDTRNSERILWTKEKIFSTDLVNNIQDIQTETVCFLVDDIVFIRPLDLDTLNYGEIRRGILSLRLGKNITFCYTKQKNMQPPTLNPSKKLDELLKFSWNESRYDWAYPLSVDGHIFCTAEILVAVTRLKYRAPNTFERALQILTPLYSKRPGYCFESPKIINIPLNRVQCEYDNISDDISPEYLLAKWQEGMTLDFKALANISTKSVHEEISVYFCKRKNHI